MAETDPATAYIGLGSNLDQPREQIIQAMRALGALPQTRLLADSGLYLSKPMVPPGGPIEQPDYYNAVAKIATALEPDALLDQLHGIEQAQQRRRDQRWGPRTIDLDLLMYDDRQINTEHLQLPHPGLHRREFVVFPLLNIDDTLEIPGHGMLAHLARQCPKNGLQFLGKLEGLNA